MISLVFCLTICCCIFAFGEWKVGSGRWGVEGGEWKVGRVYFIFIFLNIVISANCFFLLLLFVYNN
uniref:Uncharacterized protein n=1 Tax=Octopus bimaculoides TaxID=37653 RepID=A0A0L8IC65_OCTBM